MSGHRSWSADRKARLADPNIARRAVEARLRLDHLEAEYQRTLSELRHARRLTQNQLAAELRVSQAQVSRIENQADLYLSTLRGYVEALGGELQLRAVFSDGQAVSLSLGELSDLRGTEASEAPAADVIESPSIPGGRPQGLPAAAETERETSGGAFRAALQQAVLDVLACRPGRAAILGNVRAALKRAGADQQAATLSAAELRSDLEALLKEVDERALRSGRPTYLAPAADALRMARTVRLLGGADRLQDGDAPETVGSDREPELSAGRGELARMPSLPWEHAVEAHQRLVVLGEPGMGKSWLLRQVAQQLASTARASLCDPDVAAGEVILPVLVQAGALARARGATLPEALVSYLVDETMLPARSAGAVQGLVAEGGVVLLVDALDEVPRESADAGGQAPRKRLEDLLYQWAEHSPRGRVVVTSRVAGYTGPPVPGAQEAELLPFTRADIDMTVAAWSLPAGAAASLRQWLGDPAVTGMARIPLLLTLACLVAASGGSAQEDLPTSRAGLYEAVVRQLLSRDHRAADYNLRSQTPESDAEEQENLLGILAHVAFAFADTPRGWISQMPHLEVLDAVRSASEVYAGLAVSPPAVLERLTGQAGILVPAGNPVDSGQQYEFLHRTFAEYLAAHHLLELPGDDRMTIIAEHQWFDPDWTEVFTMLGGLLNESPRPGEARSLAAWFLDQSPDPLHYAFRTALRILGEAPSLEALLGSTRKRSIRAKTVRLLTSGATRDMLSQTLAAASTLPLPVTEALLSLLNNQDRDVRRAAASMLARREGPEAPAALISFLNDQDRSVRETGATGWAGGEGPEVTAALITLINDHDEDVRQAAAGVLTGRESPEVTAALLNDHHEDIRRAAAIMLGRREGPEATAALLSLLNDKDHGVRLTAARELARRDEEEILLQLGLSDTGAGQAQERFKLADIIATRTYFRVSPSDRERVRRQLDNLTRQV